MVDMNSPIDDIFLNETSESDSDAPLKEQKKLQQIYFGLKSDKGYRRTMEDTYFFSKDFFPEDHKLFIGIYDGHSGKGVSRFCRDNLHKDIKTFLHKGCTLSDSLTQAHYKMDTNIKISSIKTSNRSGSTSIVIVFNDFKEYTIANLGDSRAVLCRKGRAINLTSDHRPVMKSEKERIEKSGGFIDDERVNGILSVSRAFGDYENGIKLKGMSAEPDVTNHKISKEDEFIIMACDGLWDLKNSQYWVTLARRILQKTNNTQIAANSLVKEAINLYATDNITVAIIGFARPYSNNLADLKIVKPMNIGLLLKKRYVCKERIIIRGM